jgi:thiol-disulfide isomerase/thioredoxin
LLKKVKIRVPAILLSGCLFATSLYAGGLSDAASVAEAMRRFDPAATVRVVNVWATWCSPCIAEIKDIQSVYAEYADRGVQVVGVSMDDVISDRRAELRAKVSRFLTTSGVTYDNVYFTGRITTLQEDLRFEGEIPLTILYDGNGDEIIRFQGAVSRAKLKAAIDKVLNGRNATTR